MRHVAADSSERSHTCGEGLRVANQANPRLVTGVTSAHSYRRGRPRFDWVDDFVRLFRSD